MKKKKEKEELDEFEILHGRKATCTCDEDPDYCEVHNNWGQKTMKFR